MFYDKVPGIFLACMALDIWLKASPQAMEKKVTFWVSILFADFSVTLPLDSIVH